MTIDLDHLLPEPDRISTETLACLCDLLHDLADAIENRHCGRLLAWRRREYERQAIAEARADQHHPEQLDDSQLPF